MIRDEEMYTDKDRAAAAAMGSKDIKQSLKMKKKMDRSRMLQIPEEAQPGNFLALANYEMLRGDLEKALDCINKALELNPEEKSALVARSKCYILLGQPDKALQDAEKALEIDKKYVKALYQKAEALYYLGHFEHSLMYYHRGLKIRPEHEGFQLGVKKAQKAIKNAIGSGMNTSKKKLFSNKPRGKDSSKTSSKISTPSSKSSSSTKEVANESQQQTLKETKSKCSSSKS
ncbi:tetratricopeptide repeat protein 25, partial [Agrilus planipennis]|uniref:Outer dynein arm-docking complex subunit 4 n=1 Tax=Agrilus planipennis TaxID=224129 RepID=A0A1W4W9N5_AGRPL